MWAKCTELEAWAETFNKPWIAGIKKIYVNLGVSITCGPLLTAPPLGDGIISDAKAQLGRI